MAVRRVGRVFETHQRQMVGLEDSTHPMGKQSPSILTIYCLQSSLAAIPSHHLRANEKGNPAAMARAATLCCFLLACVGVRAGETDRGDRLFNAYFQRQVKQIADAALADVKTRADWEKQRPELRRQFLDMMGLWPLPPRTNLKPVVVGTLDAPNFTVEKLHFQSVPGLYV